MFYQPYPIESALLMYELSSVPRCITNSRMIRTQSMLSCAIRWFALRSDLTLC